MAEEGQRMQRARQHSQAGGLVPQGLGMQKLDGVKKGDPLNCVGLEGKAMRISSSSRHVFSCNFVQSKINMVQVNVRGDQKTSHTKRKLS